MSCPTAGGGRSSAVHQPVLVREVLHWLDLRPGLIVVDGTVGAGGHSRQILSRIGPEGLLIGLDRDPMMLKHAAALLDAPNVRLVQSSYARLPEVLRSLSLEKVDRVLLDLGLSSDQLADAGRGFGFDAAGPLDLRFDASQGEPAWKLLEHVDLTELERILKEYGEEPFGGLIARRIVERRAAEPVRTATDLTQAVTEALPGRIVRDARKHPATRVFQALRIAVNQELDQLASALKEGIPDSLAPGGRAVVIAFHSLEDRIVKEAFRDDVRWENLTSRPVQASAAEQRLESQVPHGEAAHGAADVKHGDAKDADWGFAPESGGLARETKIGLTLVLVLGCAFGFVYWQKANKKKDLYSAATAENKDDAPTPTRDEPKKDAQVEPAGNESSDPFADPAPAPKKPARGAARTKEKGEVSDLFSPPAQARPNRAAPAPPSDNDDPFAAAPPARAARTPARPPAATLEADDFTAAPAGPSAAARRNAPPAPPDDNDDPFAAVGPPNRGGRPLSPPPAELEPPMADAQPSDPREPANGVGGFEPSPMPPGRTIMKPTRVMAPPANNAFEQPVRVMPSPRALQPGAPNGFAAGRPPVSQPLEAGPAEFEPPLNAPQKVRSGAAAPFAATARPAAPVEDNRPGTYEVQPNDNYWKISSKLYGTAKYFHALELANADRIPDATKLRPGMKVVTPSPEALEARFPQFFSKSAGGPGAEGTSCEQPGLFLSRTGQPMYRIGAHDSLATIAKDHLGRSSRWIQIYEMNRDQLKTPNDLKVGTILKLPLDASSVRMVQNGGTVR